MLAQSTRVWGIGIAVAVAGTWAWTGAAPTLVGATASRPPGSCGVERWAVKTLSDPDAPDVTASPIATTVEQLRALPLPGSMGHQTPRYAVEKRIYKVSAKLRGAKKESDRDYHLVLVGATSATMVAEIPDPACLNAEPPKPSPGAIAAITQARTYFDQTFPRLSEGAAKDLTPMNDRPVTVTGVLFFDFFHNQTGCAKVPPSNPQACVELHPVLSIQTP